LLSYPAAELGWFAKYGNERNLSTQCFNMLAVNNQIGLSYIVCAAKKMISEREILEASILVVDDQQSSVELIEKMLHEWGYVRVQSTTDPTQVCKLHCANRYDLILLDMQMPGMDGFAVMRALIAEALDPYLCVIVITAQPEHKLLALNLGARDFISKPFDFVEVKTRIRNMLEVRLLNLKLERFAAVLSDKVDERTAELRSSEARFRSLAELVSDWYWEQDAEGEFTRISGPVLEMLGIEANLECQSNNESVKPKQPLSTGWDEVERDILRSYIESRQPFHDFVFGRTNLDGGRQYYRVSGEPMFDQACRYIGYRGIGVETAERI
jgi:CheY-like chemotaxis protein